MGVVAAARAGGAIDRAGPRVSVARVVRPGGEGLAEALVAGEAAGDPAMLAGRVGDRGDAGLGREGLSRGKAAAILPELGEDLGRGHRARTGEQLHAPPIGSLLHL